MLGCFTCFKPIQPIGIYRNLQKDKQFKGIQPMVNGLILKNNYNNDTQNPEHRQFEGYNLGYRSVDSIDGANKEDDWIRINTHHGYSAFSASQQKELNWFNHMKHMNTLGFDMMIDCDF